MAAMKLLVGLGNPGAQYERTRHNAGFWLIDRLARASGARLQTEPRFHGLAARTTIAGESCWLLEPQTFMNVSGRAVAALANFYKIEAADVIVAHDELDLPPGSAKMKLGGGFAGHNGLKDITAQLGTRDFWRLRLGIGHPGDKAQVHSYVLNAPRAEEQTLIDEAIDRALGVIDCIARGDFEAAMLRLHTKDKPPMKGTA
jgi:peptidyl-tRNA hydrolase, PTH1 family